MTMLAELLFDRSVAQAEEDYERFEELNEELYELCEEDKQLMDTVISVFEEYAGDIGDIYIDIYKREELFEEIWEMYNWTDREIDLFHWMKYDDRVDYMHKNIIVDDMHYYNGQWTEYNHYYVVAREQ